MKKTMVCIAAVLCIGAARLPVCAEVKIGDSAPAFILKDAQETSTYALESYRKKQIVLLNFFATWCENCQEEMKALKELHAKYKDSGLQIISVSVQERPEKVRRFIARYQLPFTVLLDQVLRPRKSTASRDFRII